MVAGVEAAVTELVPLVGVRAACAAVGRSRATHYRHHRVGAAPAAPRPRVEPRRQPRALSEAERAEVLDVLHDERFAAPATVYATLLDEGLRHAARRGPLPVPRRPHPSHSPWDTGRDRTPSFTRDEPSDLGGPVNLGRGGLISP
jgi:hypothetical protein